MHIQWRFEQIYIEQPPIPRQVSPLSRYIFIKLKCQIVRISTACTLIPKGMQVINAETGEVESP